MSSAYQSLKHSSTPAAALGYMAARPRMVAIASVAGLSALGWLWVAVIQARKAEIWDVLCGSYVAAFTPAETILLFLMWSAMALAMMMPGAAPMILTYAEISDTAARQRQRIVSPFVLAAGYLLAWLGFAAIAAIAHIALGRSGLLDEASTGLIRIVSGTIILGAGLYQFSALKHSCLRVCRQPFQFFFTNWSTTTGGVLRLGVRQGVHCVGCCWAMMLVMFATGAMNIGWMVALGIAMTVEKVTGDRMTQGLGVALIVTGLTFVLSGFWVD